MPFVAKLIVLSDVSFDLVGFKHKLLVLPSKEFCVRSHALARVSSVNRIIKSSSEDILHSIEIQQKCSRIPKCIDTR